MGAEVRVRFAPSPTGPLHIGGVRTALYNYLFARKHGGKFLLRIEDTDQLRKVDGAEEYIMEALSWLGFPPDEGVEQGGEHGPYRQSDRADIYKRYVQQLLDSGHAYYAFDTPEELDAMRERETANGKHSPKYDGEIRMKMKNGMTMSPDMVQMLIDKGTPAVVRMKVPQGEIVGFDDVVRGRVQFDTSELDDKVIMKTDGLPTYHLANVVDDHLMAISHVIRGEEWLSSTAHHVLLYRSFGWESEMPVFAHLPLIMKPAGKGKLSKRDGAKFGFPVFPLEWYDTKEQETFTGFREMGFLPPALNNFLALLGWNPGTDEELFSMEQLCEQFSLEKINKSGAQFNYDKAKWFNQQYIMETPTDELYDLVSGAINEQAGREVDSHLVKGMINMMKPRVERLNEFVTEATFFWDRPSEYDAKTLSKKYKSENESHFDKMINSLKTATTWTVEQLQTDVKGYINENGLKFGAILPILRVWVTGSMAGPDLFEMMELLGQDEIVARMEQGLAHVKTI